MTQLIILFQRRWQRVQQALASSAGAKLWPIDKLRNKWACTIHRFKEAHDKVKKSGRGATNFHYYDVMEKLFLSDARVERTVSYSTSQPSTPQTGSELSEGGANTAFTRSTLPPNQKRMSKRPRENEATQSGKQYF